MRKAIRQPIVSTSRPPTSGPTRARADVADGPDAERAAALGPSENVCVMIESAPGNQERAGRALEQAEDDQATRASAPGRTGADVIANPASPMA